MRNLLLSLLFAGLSIQASLATVQQSTPQATGWSAVEALNAGTTVHVIGRSHSAVCKVAKVDDTSLTCVATGANAGEVFQKPDIKKVKLPRRAASTLVGMGIGAGVGAGIGAGVGAGQNSNSGIGITKGQATGIFVAIGGVVFALIGALVGAATDFMATTLYKG